MEQNNQQEIYDQFAEEIEEYRMKRLSKEYGCKRGCGGVRE